MELIHDYKQLLLAGRPMIDLRAPVEFAKGAFPSAVNLPLMSDEERAAVGTCYKQQGQAAAIELGHRLVGGDIRQQRLDDWISFIQQHPDAVIYCFRGGLRSETVQQWLCEAGYPVARVAGGYKALRGLLVETIERTSNNDPFTLLCGMTGVGKTDVLHQLSNTIDLEKHANHRGSAFGQLPDGQPGNIDFENRLAIEILEKARHGTCNWVVEDESRMVGSNCVPLPLYSKMQQSPLVVLEADIETRAERIRRDYVVNLLHYYRQAARQGEDAEARFSDYLRQSLARLKKRLGDQGWRQLDGIMQSALKQQMDSGNTDLHLEWIDLLLRRYYDPIYLRHIKERQEKVIFCGDEAACLEYLQQQTDMQR